MNELLEFKGALSFVSDNKESQVKLIKKHLEAGKTITPLYALYKFGILRLADVVYKLKKLDLNIETTMVSINGKRFAEYKLIKDEC